MKSAFKVGWGVLVLSAILLRTEAKAEKPPSAYPDPNKASEVVEIEVLSVNMSFLPFASGMSVSCFEVKVVGKVVAVHRTDTGLKAGASITIHYDIQTHQPGWFGAGSFPVLTKGGIYKAHLNRENGRLATYNPFGAPYNAFEDKNKKK